MLQFKDKIKKLRKEKDMTQEQLAEYMGVSPQAVSRWENGVSNSLRNSRLNQSVQYIA